LTEPIQVIVLTVQVCLAAEECGHLNFDSRVDMWWNSDSFHCGSGPRGTVHFHDIFLKVCPPSPTAAKILCRSSSFLQPTTFGNCMIST
jgi:hypothetical protein